MKKVTFVLALVGVVLMFLSGCIPQETRNFTLTMLEPSGNGNLIPTVGEHTYQEGSVVDIKATPDTGWQFVKWEVNGDEYSTDAETTITINDDKEVKAYFELIPPTEYTLTMLEPSGNGNVIPTVGEHTYQEGSVVDIKATPDTGWQFVKWEVNGGLTPSYWRINKEILLFHKNGFGIKKIIIIRKGSTKFTRCHIIQRTVWS